MSRNISAKLVYDSSGTDSFSIAASGFAIVDIDTYAIHNLQALIEGTYATTAATTGLSAAIFYGMGPADSTATGNQVPCVLGGVVNSNIKMSDNSDSISMATFTPSSSNVTKRSFFSSEELTTKLPRWVRLRIANLDASNAVTIKIYLDV